MVARALALGLLLLAPAVPVGAADPVAVPNTTLEMVPPAGFAPSDRFAGFVDRARAAVILVAELPAGMADQLRRSFAPGPLAARGLTLRAIWPLGAAPGAGFVVSLVGTDAEIGYRKWIGVRALAGATVVVTITVPESGLDGLDEAAVAQAIRSVGRRAGAPPAVLPFTVTPAAGFAVRQGLMGTTLILSDRTRAIADARDQPLFIVSASHAPPPGPGAPDPTTPDAVRRLADRLVAAVSGLDTVRVETSDPLEVDGLPGRLHTADAVNAATGTRTRLVHAVLVAPDRHFRLIGIAPAALAARYQPRFVAMVASFRRTADHR